MKKIIIDTDPGKDDTLAIILAINSRIFDIKAITTVAGNSKIENTTKNAQYVLKLMKSKIKIYSGSKKPINKIIQESIIQGKEGLSGIKNYLKPRLTNNAPDKIAEILEKNPYEVSIICLAPLTNIAKTIEKFPSSMKKVKELVIMGGALKVRGNQTKFAEFNFFTDPEAAKKVLDFPVKKKLISLDVCNQIILNTDDFKKIKEKRIKNFCEKIMDEYISLTKKEEGFDGALMYDPLAVYLLINPDACRFRKLKLSVISEGKKEGKLIENRFGNEISFVEKIDSSKFKKDFVDILSGDYLKPKRLIKELEKIK